MRQRFSGGLHGRVVGGWHLEKAHRSVPWFPVCWQGTAPRVRTARNSLKQVGLPRSYPGIGVLAEWQGPHKLA